MPERTEPSLPRLLDELVRLCAHLKKVLPGESVPCFAHLRIEPAGPSGASCARDLLLGWRTVIALSRNDPRARATLAAAREAGVEVSIPSAVVAETVRGSAEDASVNRVIKAVGEVTAADEGTGRVAGALLGTARSRQVYGALVLFPIVALILMTASGVPGAILGLMAAPALAPLGWRFGQVEGGPALNALLVDTARAGTRSGLLAAVGIVFVSLL